MGHGKNFGKIDMTNFFSDTSPSRWYLTNNIKYSVQYISKLLYL